MRSARLALVSSAPAEKEQIPFLQIGQIRVERDRHALERLMAGIAVEVNPVYEKNQEAGELLASPL